MTIWTGWNDAAIDTMKRMTANGSSAAQVAKVLGCTRNAVCGKRDRMGILSLNAPWVPGSGLPPAKPYRPSRSDNAKAQHAVRKVKRPRTNIISGFIASTKPKPPTDPTLAEEPDMPCEPVTLLDLKPHCCKWPVRGEGADTLFCSAVSGDAVYCPAHARRAYNRAPSPLRSADFIDASERARRRAA